MTRRSITPSKRKSSRKFKGDIFFENLQARRLELGFTQDDMAVKLGIDRAHVSRMEAGAFPKDPRRLVALADALGVSLDWLFGRLAERKEIP